MTVYEERKRLISELESYRGRTLISLITSTKRPEAVYGAQIAQDQLPLFYELLKQEPNNLKLDLFLYSSGGQIDVPWPLINLIRNYTEDIIVLVPWRAHSAATMLALGANSIEMSPLGSLSPIDPQFQIKLSEKDIVGAGIEDVYGYYYLVKETLGLDSAGRSEALRLLAGRVHPEILGRLARIRQEIKIIATNLLRLHINDNPRIGRIVSALVEDLPSHQYLINLREAKQLGLPVNKFDETTEKLADQLFKSYQDESRMEEFGFKLEFGDQVTITNKLSRAFTESKRTGFAYTTEYLFHRDGKIEKKGDLWRKE